MMFYKLILISSVEGKTYYYKLNTDFLTAYSSNIMSISENEYELQINKRKERYDLPRTRKKRKSDDEYADRYDEEHGYN